MLPIFFVNAPLVSENTGKESTFFKFLSLGPLVFIAFTDVILLNLP